MADRIRYPEGGVSADAVKEIRRIKARVDAERLPRGADPATHTKLGRGGLADIEWTVQLLQLKYGHRYQSLHNTSTLQSLDAIGSAELLAEDDVPAVRDRLRDARDAVGTVRRLDGPANELRVRIGTAGGALLRLMLGVGLMASFTLMLGYRTRFSLGVATLVLFSFVTR